MQRQAGLFRRMAISFPPPESFLSEAGNINTFNLLQHFEVLKHRL